MRASPVAENGLQEVCGLRYLRLLALETQAQWCDTQAQLLWGVWDLPRPGIEPTSPESAGGFFDTEPPGKPRDLCFNLLQAHDGVETEVSEPLSKNSPLPSPPRRAAEVRADLSPSGPESVCLSVLEHLNLLSQGLPETSQPSAAEWHLHGSSEPQTLYIKYRCGQSPQCAPSHPRPQSVFSRFLQ